mgnify:CR=1 FL=1
MDHGEGSARLVHVGCDDLEVVDGDDAEVARGLGRRRGATAQKECEGEE